MKKSRWILGLVLLLALAALFLWARSRIHFDFQVFAAQVALADWRKIAIGTAFIYLAFVFRAARWTMLMRHNKKVPLFSLLGTQLMGFTAVALIGRFADPVRPYLVAKKTGEPLGSQVAVYIVERLFDFGSMALIFSLALLWIPQTALSAAPGHAGFLSHLFAPLIQRYPIFSVIFARFGALLATLAGVLLLVAVRLSGNAVASFFEQSFGLVSKSLGQAAGHKIRTFHAGLDVIHSLSDFAISASISLSMWILIALAYLETVHAFTASPPLAGDELFTVRSAHDDQWRRERRAASGPGLVFANRFCGCGALQLVWRNARGCYRLRSYHFARHIPLRDSRRAHLGAIRARESAQGHRRERTRRGRTRCKGQNRRCERRKQFLAGR